MGIQIWGYKIKTREARCMLDVLDKAGYNPRMYTRCLKYRIYPAKAQETRLEQTLATCRDMYNSLLNERKHDYEVYGKASSRYEQQKHFPHWSKQYPEVAGVFSQVLQNVAVRVGLAFDAFFRRVKKGETPGYPRFKPVGQYDSFTYPQSGFKAQEQSVTLSKIGTIKATIHRPITGRIKTCTVRRQNEKWYVCFAVECEPEPLPASSENIGIDVGLNQFAALSSGEMIANPRFYRADEKALAKAQRKVEKHKKGSPQQRKARKVVRRIHERIRNRRHNFIHQESRKIVNRYGLMALEKLQVKNLLKRPAPKQEEQTGQYATLSGTHAVYLPNGASQKAGLNKSIGDAAWPMFRFALAYKAESAGRKVVEVNPAYTSQECSGCGKRVPKALKERVHYCPNCGLRLDRDTNAALNILVIAMGQHSVAGIPA